MSRSASHVHSVSPRAAKALGLVAALLLAGPAAAVAKPKRPDPHRAPKPTPAAANGEGGAQAGAGRGKAARTEPDEAWYDFKFQGQKVGFLFASDEDTTVNGRPARHARRWTVIHVRRKDQTIRMESTTDAWSEPDGKPMRYKHTRLEGGETRALEGYRDGDQLVVRRETGGNVTESRLPLGPNTYLSFGLDTLFKQDLRPGKALSGKVIAEEDGEVREVKIAVTGTEARPEGEVYVVEEEVGGLKSRELVRKDGRTLRMELPALGAEFVLTTRELAMKEQAAVDVFSAGLFSVAAPLPKGVDLEELVVLLRGKSGRVPAHVADARQRAKKVGSDAVELRIRAEDPPVKAPRLPIAAPAVKAYLVETPYEALKDEVLVGTAKKVVGDERDAWAAAKRINAFVHRHIEKKTLARAFGTANEALASKEGDCTEHAVLFSALAKIVGIPTRLVTGLVYVGGRENTFGYHEWVEVWMGERWLPMDPTFGQDLADPTHIKFDQGLSDAEGLRQAGIVATGVIADLELKVLEHTDTAGAKVKVSAK